MTHVITEMCIGTRAGKCADACPYDAITRGPYQFLINPAKCTNCGICVPVCPTQAIFPLEKVPEQYRASIETNARESAP